MGGARRSRGLAWRALVPILVATPVVGVLCGQMGGSAGAASARSRNPSTTVVLSAGVPTSVTGRSPSTAPAATAGVSLEEPPAGTSAPPATPGETDAPATAAFVADPGTEAQVAQDLVVAIDGQSHGAYDIAGSAANVALLESWMANEGGLWADNPLNTSLDSGRYPHQFTSGGTDTGIPIYPDIEIGIEATATTLLSNHAYADILRALDGDSGDCPAFARAVIDSPWAASHYGFDPARFCGASTGSGTAPVGPVTACLRLPNGGKRGIVHDARVPGACGRFGAHGARARRAGHDAHATAPRHDPAHRDGPAHLPAHPHETAHHAAAGPGVVHRGRR